MVVAMLGAAVMPAVSEGNAWAAFRNFVWSEAVWKGFVADATVAITLGILSAKYGGKVGALFGLQGAAAGVIGGFIIGVDGGL